MEPRFQGPHHYSGNDLRNSAARSRLRLVEPSEKEAAVLSSLGQDLRNARQAKGLEISQVSSSLKISKRHLNAIEESNVEALPLGDVYLIGYARTYANYLGLNTGQCLEKLKSEIAERGAKCQVPIAQNLPQETTLPRALRYTLRFLGIGSYEL
jgi:transcriptional regulator with XRE-family HTH domain